MTPQIKKIIQTVFGILIILLIGFTITLSSFYLNLKKDRERISNNFQNSQFKLDSVINKNGQLQYSVQTLTLKNDEFKQFAPELVKEITNMGLKVKNLESVVKANVRYEYSIDTVEVEKKSENVFIGKFNDAWLNISERVTLIDNKTNVKIDSLHLNLTDSLLMPHEILYKPVLLFWKKPIGIKVWVKSNNPHFKIDKLVTYKLIK